MFTTLLAVACIIVGIRLVRYITTPLGKATGFYQYYSPIFFTVPISPKTFEFHLGTSWDYFHSGKITQRTMLISLAQGLVNLCTAIENGNVPLDRKYKGNTYYFSRATVDRFGFQSRGLNPIEILLFSLNYPELCLLYSVTNRHPCLVPLKNVRIISCTAAELMVNKDRFEKVLEQMRSRACSAPAQPVVTAGEPLKELALVED